MESNYARFQRFQNHVNENSELRTLHSLIMRGCTHGLAQAMYSYSARLTWSVILHHTNSFKARYRYLPDPVKLNEKCLSVLAKSVCMDILYDNKCCNLRWPPPLAFPLSPTPSGWSSKTENEDKSRSSPKLAGSCGHCNWPVTRHIKSKGSTANIINIPPTSTRLVAGARRIRSSLVKTKV